VLFNNYYDGIPAAAGDVSFFNEAVPHYGTANNSSQERAVVFFMFVPIGFTAGQCRRGPVVRVGARAYTYNSAEYLDVRNAHTEMDRVIALLVRCGRMEEYNARAPITIKYKREAQTEITPQQQQVTRSTRVA